MLQANTVPHDIFTKRKKRLLLVVAKDFKHNWLSLDVVHEWSSNLNSNLQKQKQSILVPKLLNTEQCIKLCMTQADSSYVLHMVEAERRAAACVF